MENTPNRKLKKVKRPIKRPAYNADTMAVPAKSISENPFNRGANMNNNSFELDAYIENDSLPAMRQDIPHNRLNPNFIPNDDIEEAPASFKDHFIIGDLYTGTAVIATALFCIILGFFIAKTFFATPTLVQNGLQGIVINSEVPKGRARCGVAEKTQGCVLYIMNPQRQDLSGRDFYDLASQLTGRQRYMIDTGNMRYSGTKIRPGEIAQINIPPLQ